LEQVQEISSRNARRLIEQLASFEFVKVPRIAPEAEPVFLRLPIILKTEKLAEEVFYRLSQIGIGISRSYSRSIPDLYAKEFPSNGKIYPGASGLAACLLTLPTHAYLHKNDIERIIKVLKSIDHDI
jgi:dTDP-4-amino-4,6-dideoxygalactose transaminase